MSYRGCKGWKPIWITISSQIRSQDDIDKAFVIVVIDQSNLRIAEEGGVVEIQDGRLGKVQPHRCVGESPTCVVVEYAVAFGRRRCVCV
jgi:hypothetical protein